jgi:membrane protease YdiL (CAAX protease family)
MIKTLVLSFIEILAITPILFFTMQNNVKNKWKVVALCIAAFISNAFLLDLPRNTEAFNFIGGSWNWSGKILALAGSIAFYFIIKKKYINGNNFFRIKQAKGSLKPILIALFSLWAIVCTFTLFSGNKMEFTIETLLFQLVPGIEEEIIFRGILLGIPLTILNDKIKLGKINIGNPAIYATALLFGISHALSFSNQWAIEFNIGYSIITTAYGFVWGWMAIKSKSILMPILSHNLVNLSITIIAMAG